MSPRSGFPHLQSGPQGGGLEPGRATPQVPVRRAGAPSSLAGADALRYGPTRQPRLAASALPLNAADPRLAAVKHVDLDIASLKTAGASISSSAVMPRSWRIAFLNLATLRSPITPTTSCANSVMGNGQTPSQRRPAVPIAGRAAPPVWRTGPSMIADGMEDWMHRDSGAEPSYGRPYVPTR